ncbi:hypothetical protein [Bradyrhizobium sp. Gha]|uniref:hypothetical protein n=1 Tax=Bradyrhizobium sp. Gha TaxID=1855318 RepID=UPI001160C2F0|nr:hypothetical protein [Bradyrhizobium sp. Gha]
MFGALGGLGVRLSSPAALGAARAELKQTLESGCLRLQLSLPFGAPADVQKTDFHPPNENRCVTPFNEGGDIWFALKESRPPSSTEGLLMTALPP